MDPAAPTTTKVKMSGYLHLKNKKRMMSNWKNYWFVLEDRLLLFYRSKDEYQAISPCKGSINLGPPCAVKSLPSVANAFQVVTRTVTYTLKAENSDEQKKWMQAMLSALQQNQNFTNETPKRLSHFRYSLDDLIPEREPHEKAPFERQNSVPHKLKIETQKSNEIIQRLQKIGAHSYGGSLGAISKIATKKCPSPVLTKNNNSKASQGSLPNYHFDDEEEILRKSPYRENIYERISGDSLEFRNSFWMDNENYSVPLRKSVGMADERKRAGMVDEAKSAVTPTRETKSLMVENDQYQTTRQVQSEEVIYAEPKLNEVTDCNKNSVLVENSFYASADVTSRESAQSENLYEDLDKFSHYSTPVLKKAEENSSHSSQELKMKRDVVKEEVKSIKKSRSFMRRVWRKKGKKEREQPREEEIYAEVDPVAVEKVVLTDDSAIQMLSELHNILENKKILLRAHSNQSTDDSQTPGRPAAPDSVCPSLPPKTQKMFQDTKPNQPIEQVRSLDEILEDLEREKVESRTKVQMLIRKFSEGESDDVILRKRDKSDSRSCRHSDELNTLLNELAKVTSAPIMTPGVTSSLVNPNLTDEEWLKLLPVRQRRLSEPDYDIPRPHKPIQPPAKPEATDAIPVTRFLGPVLPPTVTDDKDDSLDVSMTPDSLEVEQHKFQTHCSYTSHNYYHNTEDLKRFSHDYGQTDKVIYAMPKSYVSVATHVVNTCPNICTGQMADECTIIYKNVKNVETREEIFNDSLELCNESSTEF